MDVDPKPFVERRVGLPQLDAGSGDAAQVVIDGDRAALIENLKPRHGSQRAVHRRILGRSVACLLEQRDRLLAIEVVGEVEGLLPELRRALGSRRVDERQQQPDAKEESPGPGPARRHCAT